MDELIEKSNSLLLERGFEPMPLDVYDFYRKSDSEILRGIREKNTRRKEDTRQDEEPEVKSRSGNNHRGTKMVLRQYFNWLDSGSDSEVPYIQVVLIFQLMKYEYEYENQIKVSFINLGFSQSLPPART